MYTSLKLLHKEEIKITFHFACIWKISLKMICVNLNLKQKHIVIKIVL